MKLAFSTLTCPAWSFDQIVEAGRQYGYDGIEFRGLMGEIDLPSVPEFSPARIADTRKRLEDAGLHAACLSSSVSVVALTKAEIDCRTAVSHAKRYVELAHEIGAPYIRLFCGDVPAGMLYSAAVDRAADSLRRIGDFARQRGVVAVVETHDQFVRSEKLMELIRLTNHPAVQVLWDIHHPYRMEGESVEHSMRYFDGHVRHTHVKDSVQNADGESYTYVLTGEGDVPILPAMRALKQAGYDGYLALEWEKLWHPELAPPEVVLPQYAEQMKAWLKEL